MSSAATQSAPKTSRRRVPNKSTLKPGDRITARYSGLRGIVLSIEQFGVVALFEEIGESYIGENALTVSA